MSKKQDLAVEPIEDLAALRADIDKGLKHYKVFESAKAAIDLVQSLDGQVKSCEQRLATADKVLADRQSQLEEVNAQIAAVQELASRDTQAAKEFAEKLVADAKAEASDIIGKAKGKQSDIEDKVARAEQDLAVIKKDIDALEAKKAELEAFIAKIKAV